MQWKTTSDDSLCFKFGARDGIHAVSNVSHLRSTMLSYRKR